MLCLQSTAFRLLGGSWLWEAVNFIKAVLREWQAQDLSKQRSEKRSQPAVPRENLLSLPTHHQNCQGSANMCKVGYGARFL